MSFNIKMIEADTHSPEYLLHKYWARKPHNVIHECIKSLVPPNGSILDPFCGSGVTLREAGIQSIKATGIDVNPIACLISKVLIDPPLLSDFESTIAPIISNIEDKLGYMYETSNGKKIKYLAHRIEIQCKCGQHVTSKNAEKFGKTYRCPKCGEIVRFNLENLSNTEIFDICVDDKSNNKNFTNNELIRQEKLSNSGDYNSNYDFPFSTNRRILAFQGLHTVQFFTKRNYFILSEFADRFHEIKDQKIKNAALLLLTASVAQCSRLIAYRNNMSTGGPAWSIPGFWVPMEHLETNPFIHIKARQKKFERGLQILNANPCIEKPSIINENSLFFLNMKEHADEMYDLIFLDPPYGDSVPYVEFSAIWNSFLKIQPNPNEDISVSDRISKTDSWNQYSLNLMNYMNSFTKHLKPSGKLLITFNNNDMKAWFSLLTALQKCHFVCESVIYQVPAVISSKAQKSLASSYISDIYSVYCLSPNQLPTSDTSLIITDLSRISSIRKGVVNKGTLDREFILSFLRNNISVSILSEKDNIVNSMFYYNDIKKVYTLKKDFVTASPDLTELIIKETNLLIQKGPISLNSCFQKVAGKLSSFGTVELFEFKDAIKDFVVEKGKIYGKPQPTLFD